MVATGSASVAASGHAPALAAAANTLGAIVVTVVVLLALGAVFWSFLRRAGTVRAPLAVDRRAAPRLPEPADPGDLPGSVAGSTAVAASTARALEDEIGDGSPVTGGVPDVAGSSDVTGTPDMPGHDAGS